MKLYFISLKEQIVSNLYNILIILFLFNASLTFNRDVYYFRGILVDYLIPQLYLNQAILFVILFLLKPLHIRSFYYFLLLFIVNFIFSTDVNYSLSFISTKILIFVSLFYFINQKNVQYKLSFNVLFIVNLIYFIIYFIQLLTRSSYFPYFPFGFYYYFGGSNLLDYIVLDSTKHVIPLGNFPHPNVFAAFISFLNLLYIFKFKNYLIPIFNTVFIFFLGSISSFYFMLIILSYSFIKKYKNLYLRIVLLLLFLLSTLYAFIILYKPVSFSSRVSQFNASIHLISENILFGVGYGNFIPSLIGYESVTGTIINLQPVHNIYLLYVAEFGILGVIFLLILIYRNSRYFMLTPFLFYIIYYSLFDHFLYTVNQGLLLALLTILLHKTIIDTSK